MNSFEIFTVATYYPGMTATTLLCINVSFCQIDVQFALYFVNDQDEDYEKKLIVFHEPKWIPLRMNLCNFVYSVSFRALDLMVLARINHQCNAMDQEVS